MGPAYERYYTERLAALASSVRIAAQIPFVADVVEAVDQGIEAAHLPHPYRLRPDARLFLVINFEELVILPTLSVEGPTPAGSLRQLVVEDIPRDVSHILRRAAQRAASERDIEISSLDVMRVIATDWNQLAFAAPWRWER